MSTIFTVLKRRFWLVLLGVVVAHSLPWNSLREATTAACVTCSRWVGLDAVRLTPTGFALSGWPLSVDVACTMIDVYLAALPLLYSKGETAWGNARPAICFFVGLMVLNITRLVAGFWLYEHGVSWLIAHEIFAGFVYFAIFQYLSRTIDLRPSQ